MTWPKREKERTSMRMYRVHPGCLKKNKKKLLTFNHGDGEAGDRLH